MTSRELVHATLEFRNTAGRVPRQLWTLPWSEERYPEMMRKIRADFPMDVDGAPVICAQQAIEKGDPYEPGEYTDAWGCTFVNIHRGTIGEVKKPLVTGEDWEDAGKVHIPSEWLTFDADTVNAFCRASDKFVMAGVCPRPFEQLQFIRGTADLYMDLMDPPAEMLRFMDRMHAFYCELLEKWARTEVDCLQFMDDWGAQNQLLISPALWTQYFRPMYRDYIDIAHRNGKKIFMHSDGHTLSILPQLIEMGLDAINTQIFCIGMDKLAPFRGKMTFWGEIDRQRLIPHGSLEEIDQAVDLVYDTLWQNGGCLAQCEFGAGGRPENVYRIYRRWGEKGK